VIETEAKMGPVDAAVADDVLAASKVRYSWNLSAAPHLGERPESAHLAHCRAFRRRSPI